VLKGDNPDNSFSTVPYEKGYQFLYYINSTIGADEMQDFLQYYIYMNFEKSITTIELRNNWETWVQDNYEKNDVNPILAAINWEEWMYIGGMSPEPIDFTNSASDEATNLALEFISLNGTAAPEQWEEYLNWFPNL
jgi:leukotriene-A4 hydrolase